MKIFRKLVVRSVFVSILFADLASGAQATVVPHGRFDGAVTSEAGATGGAFGDFSTFVPDHNGFANMSLQSVMFDVYGASLSSLDVCPGSHSSRASPTGASPLAGVIGATPLGSMIGLDSRDLGGGVVANSLSESLATLIANDRYTVVVGGSNEDTFWFSPPFTTSSSSDGVPEPETWLMFIIGFGVIGTLIRRDRKAAQSKVSTIE